ncbi:MAG: hypothetical protein EBZ58_14010 [Bacteroidetes bacterium]|jgi:hypothetical protein|nr:hypothetical protein [Bacteroidota bacterium]
MTKETLIRDTINSMNKLPLEKVKEINDFAEFLLAKIDENLLTEGIHHLVSNSGSFNFLQEEPDLYTDLDLIENYK